MKDSPIIARTLSILLLGTLGMAPVAYAAETAPAGPVGGVEVEQVTVESFDTRVAKELGLADRARSPAAVAACRRRLLDLGGPAVDGFFRALRTGRLPGEAGREGAALTARMRRAILSVYSSLPRAEVDTLLESLRETVARLGPDARRAGLEVVGALGRSDALDLLFSLAAADTDDGFALDPALHLAFEVSLSRLFARNDHVVGSVRARWKTLPDATRASVLRALGNAKRSESVDMLLDVMAFDGEQRARAIAEAPRLVALATPGEREVLGDLVRRDLDAHEPEVRRVALTTVAHLGDEEAIPALIGLLESEIAEEAELAHWALHDITGLNLRAEPRVWRRWLARERAWQTYKAPKILESLESASPTRVLGALRKIAKVRLGRAALATRVAGVLSSPSADVRSAACATLASLGAETARPALDKALGDRDQSVRDAAERALDALTAAR